MIHGSPPSIVMATSLSVGRFFPALLLLLVLSCSHDPRVENLEAAVGRLTQADMIRQFGYPQRLKRLPFKNTEVWEYEFLAGGSRCVGYRIYFDEDQRSQRWEHIPCQ